MRRTDKWNEAKFFELNEYLKHAQDFFDSYNLRSRMNTGKLDRVLQAIYLATDESNVFIEAQKK